MMFNVHTEAANSLQGYLVPDSFSGHAAISVLADGAVIYRGPCDQRLDGVVNAGRHETGMVGFDLDENRVPGLAGAHDLRIHDDDTGLLIYRRNQPATHVQQRLFRLETTLVPAAPYSATLPGHFAYGLGDIHLYGQETAVQLFNLGHYPSMYFEGRVHIKAHQRYLDAPFLCVASLTEPFLALALAVEAITERPQILFGHLEEREYTALLPLVAYLDGADITRPGALARRLRAAPRPVMACLEAPVLGLLTGDTPGVGGARGDIPAALELLSQFDMILDRDTLAQGHAELAARLGLPPGALPAPPVPEPVRALADALRAQPGLQAALENDLIVHHCLMQSMQPAPAAAR